MTAQVKALVVWGWGSGWARIGAGWWGWGLIYDAAFVVTPQAYTITVGTGGAAVTDAAGVSQKGNNWNNSTFSTLTGTGWWGWWAFNLSSWVGLNWGCWGWWTYNVWTNWAWWTGSQWFAGWTGGTVSGAGWWGMWAVGADGSWLNWWAWWAWTSNSISGAAVTYGWGGGWSWQTSGGAWWSGWGGAGSNDTPNPATSGTDWLGGGGWGIRDVADSGSKTSGKWWDWTVIISYATNWSDWVSTSSTGGTITTSGGNTIHTFTTSGTWTMVASSTSNSSFFMFF